MRISLAFLVVGVLLFGGNGRFVSTATAQNAPRLLSPLSDALRTQMEMLRQQPEDALPEGWTPSSYRELLSWYEETGFAPLWVTERGPRPQVDSLIAILNRADREGLPLQRYRADDLADRMTRMEGAEPSVSELVDLEVLCSRRLYQYASVVSFGRISPSAVTPTWNAAPRRNDLRQVFALLAETGDVASAIDAVRPGHPAYDGLLQALARYRGFADQGGWTPIPDGSTLKPGNAAPRVPLLRERLAWTGDLPASVDSVRDRAARAAPFRASPARADTLLPDETPDSNAGHPIYRFDEDLAEAVLRFQTRHGLDADTAVGPATRAAMNVTATDRARQIEANLERWRWMPNDLGSRYVVVNIAGFYLQVVDQGDVVLQMRVVTGRPYRQTPVFSDEITHVVFQPYWHVPHRLAVEDKLPAIRRDPSYLQRQGFEVFRGWSAGAQPISPDSIDWSTVNASSFPYRLRQKPGERNALGRVKIMFPNSYSVYLHDTPDRHLFQRAERGFSSGCIRLERPAELVAFLLSDQPGWTLDRVRSMMEKDGSEKTVLLRQPVPVHLQYWTAWTEGDTVHFRNDLYDRDARLLSVLDAALARP